MEAKSPTGVKLGSMAIHSICAIVGAWQDRVTLTETHPGKSRFTFPTHPIGR